MSANLVAACLNEVLVMRSLEKGDEMPMLTFDRTMRTIFVSSAIVVGCAVGREERVQ